MSLTEVDLGRAPGSTSLLAAFFPPLPTLRSEAP